VPFDLRPYQVRDIERLRAKFAEGCRSVLYQLPTGGGKTIIFCEVTRRVWSTGRRVLVPVHRRELVKQTAAKLNLVGVPFGIIAADFPASPELPVQVCSINTAVRRDIGQFSEIPDLKGMSYRRALLWAGTSEHRLRLVARARGYKPGWVFYRLQELHRGVAL
jgi:superfamily II DNA or RNA helicase